MLKRKITYGILSGLFLFMSACKQVEEQKTGKFLFELLPPEETGVNFQNTLQSDVDFNILEYDYYYNGGGVAAADFNNDGLTDLYFTGNQVSGKLYLNKGAFKFDDVTEEAGLNTTNWATGIAVADVNNDGLQDMYISSAGHLDPARRVHQLFINKGVEAGGMVTFTDEAAEYHMADTSYSTQVAFFDYDKDGDLDMYQLNQLRSKLNPNYIRKKINDGTSPSTDKLFKNESGKFVDVSHSAGINCEGYGLGISIADINQDGWPDVYVANDFVFDDLLYINNRDGTFTESIRTYIQHTSRFSMGCDIADFNNDGYPDIVVVDMLPDDNKRQKLMNIAMNNDRFNLSLSLDYMPQYSRNMLQVNNGPDAAGKYSFSEIGQLAGVFKTDWSWSPLFADFDNDGWKDLFISNGIPRDITNNDFISYRSEAIQKHKINGSLVKNLLGVVEKLDPVDKPNFIFKNDGNLQFSDQSEQWGINARGFSNGAAYADLDNDGDLDLVTNNVNSVASVFRNNSEVISANNFIRIKLNGHFAMGSKISIRCKGKNQYIEHNPYKGFQSSQDPIVHFGLGSDSIVDVLKIVWPDGKQEELTGVGANQLLTLEYKNAAATVSNASKSSEDKRPFMFTDITETTGIDFFHVENTFEDVNIEPLLPHKFSRNGPRIAVGDVDKNGLEDFWIGGPAKIPGKVFLQVSNGKFLSRDMPDPGYEDISAVFFDANGTESPDLYVVSGGNEYNPNTATYQDRLYVNDGKGNFKKDASALPAEVSSGSCVAANDFDQDGDLDLFVGGRVVPGSYPLPPQSFILRNDGKGKFQDVTSAVCSEVMNIGLVTAAHWSDFDADGWTDLIVAGEWMPVTLFKNIHGKLSKIKSPELDAATGWWFSLAEGDFDKDGDTDYIAGNLGLNNKFNVSEKTPARVYAKDLDRNGFIEPILSYYLNGNEYTVANRDQLGAVLPSIKKRFESYTKFAEAGFNEIFSSEQLKGALVLNATRFSSVYIENKGNGKFSLRNLPIEAQFSTIQSIQVNDFGGDGNLDALVAGNFFSSEFMIGRYDASIGLLLKGNGKGDFEPLPSSSSGLCMKGDVRSTAIIRIKNKACVLAAVNAGRLQVYRVKSSQ